MTNAIEFIEICCAGDLDPIDPFVIRHTYKI